MLAAGKFIESNKLEMNRSDVAKPHLNLRNQ